MGIHIQITFNIIQIRSLEGAKFMQNVSSFSHNFICIKAKLEILTHFVITNNQSFIFKVLKVVCPLGESFLSSVLGT